MSEEQKTDELESDSGDADTPANPDGEDEATAQPPAMPEKSPAPTVREAIDSAWNSLKESGQNAKVAVVEPGREAVASWLGRGVNAFAGFAAGLGGGKREDNDK